MNSKLPLRLGGSSFEDPNLSEAEGEQSVTERGFPIGSKI